ncbi:BRCA1-A complex subunit RAP80 isoform X4 [Pogona vitticeps]
MPKKKRKTVDRPNSQDLDQREEEPGRFPDASLEHSFEDACIVISDSDGEQESKEECSLQKKRTKQRLDRAKFAAKRKIAQMTEDEQFALALKMSEQEARQLNSQEEEEEELLRKAIAESLSSCQLPESSGAAALPLLSQAPESSAQSHTAGQDDFELLTAQLPCSECRFLSPSDKADDENGQTHVAKRPFVVLTRLSQEIVKSSLASSIIVSPGKSQPFARSNENSCSPAGSSSSDTPLSFGEDMPVTLSPTFPPKPRGIWPLAPQRLATGACSPLKPTGKLFQNHSEREPLAGCPEVLEKVPWEHIILNHSSSPHSEVEQSKKACLFSEPVGKIEMPGKAVSLCTLHTAERECQRQEERDTVHYYWGIPFCPKGVDPSRYTQVIMCQLEVYQKSLKQAQRQLLQKKPFGEPVVPNSYSLRQRERGKEEEAFGGGEGADEQEGEDSEEKKEPESIAWLLGPTNGEPNKNLEEKVAEGRYSEHQVERASSSCQASQVLFAEDVLEEREPVQITQSISALTPLDNKRSPDISTENHAEEEITVCPETQPSPSQAIEPESGEIHSSRKDVSLQGDAKEDAAENMSSHDPPPDDPVACPLCDRTFPVSEIELHAMYCNGMGEDITEDAPVMTRRQREAKCKLTGYGETSESVGKCEKCYLCKSVVPWKEYPRHVNACLKSCNAHGAQGGRRLRRAKEEGKQEGRLLSMLEQSENKAADAEAAVTPSRGEHLRHSSAEMDEGADAWSPFPQAACSDSPIRSFTSISEAKDCLVDFKKQLAVGSSCLKQTKASFKSRKKL